MTPIIEDAVLGSDLDCGFYDLLNVRAIDPVPSNLATSDDSRLTDDREPLPGSVHDEHVSIDAGIVQSKLNLDGQIPPGWIGSSPGAAAQGDLAEYLINKNVPGGYAGLDGSGKLLPAQLPPNVGLGTVTSVGLTMPSQFTVAGSPVTTAGTLSVGWAPVTDLSWFGNKEGVAGPPKFYTDPLPPELIPSLDASMVVSGVFDPDRLPMAGLAPGAVPAPGDGSGPGELPTDYLARDMTYKPMPAVVTGFQPVLPLPKLVLDTTVSDPVAVIVSLTEGTGDDEKSIEDEHHVFFYSTTSATGPFTEFPPEHFVKLPISGTGAVSDLWAYVAHPGMDNSAVKHIDLTP